MPERVCVKLVTPLKEGLSNQTRMHVWKMGKDWRSPFQAFRKNLLEGRCPPTGWVSVGAREGGVGFSAIDAELSAKVTWTTAFIMALVSMISVYYRGGADGTWGTGAVDAGGEKASMAEMTGDAWSHDWRGKCSRESG